MKVITIQRINFNRVSVLIIQYRRHVRFSNGALLRVEKTYEITRFIGRIPKLKSFQECFRVLKNDGLMIFLGLPDFEEVAKAYLEKKPGIVGETFDLYNVYRYTHGDPEMASSYWLEQLHKSLFDKNYLEIIVKKAGFQQVLSFNYFYPEEFIPLNLGFIAAKNKIDLQKVRDNLTKFKDYIGDFETVIIQIK